MALDFPSSPTTGQSFTDAGSTWTWDGTKWVGATGAVGITGTPANGQWAQWSGADTLTGVSTAAMPFVELTGDTMTGALTLNADPTAALHPATKQYADLKVAKAGDTMSGDLVIAKASAALTLNKTTSGQANWLLGQINGVNRWVLQLGDGNVETGGNTGSDLGIYRYTDAGALIGSSLLITRSTGLATVSGDPTAALGIATKQYVDGAAWTAYTPTVTAQSGTYGSVSATGQYRQVGKTVHLRYSVTVTTVGTAGTAAIISLPVAAKADHQCGSARDQMVGKAILSYIILGTGLYHQIYDATFPPGSFVGSITYEAA